MSALVPLVDLAAQHRSIQEEIEGAALRVLRSGVFILGPEGRSFEAELASFVGVAHAIGCASGTDAVTLALLAIDLRPGDEIILPAFTFQSDAEAVALLGGVPRFADVDPRTLTLDPSSAAARISKRTRAILPTHLYGVPADMDPLRELARRHGLFLLEDACQAIGSRIGEKRAGALADIGWFSFFPTKNLGAAGDGGALTTDDGALADRLRKLRNHGTREKHVHEAIGLNSRLDELQAAILRVKLRHLDGWTARRLAIADRYDEALGSAGIPVPGKVSGREGNAHLYTLRSPHRDAIRAALANRGVATAIHYPHATPDQPALAHLPRESTPHATRAAAEVFSLPLYPEMSDAQVDHVARAVREAWR